MLKNQMVSSRGVSRLALLVSAAVAAIPSVVVAQSWTAATGNWNTPGNWSGNAVPSSLATTALTFGGAGGYTATNNLATQPFVLNSMTFSAGSAVNVAGGTLSFSGTTPTISQNGAGAATISSAIALNAVTTVGGTGTGNLAISGRITSASASNGLQINYGGNTTLSGGSSVGFISAGLGTTTLTGSTTFAVNSTSNPGVGSPAGPDGTVAMSVGRIAGESARLVVDGGAVTSAAGQIYVGNGGTGSLVVRNGGSIVNRDAGLTTGGRFGVLNGTGSILVESGGVVSTRLFELGRQISDSSLTVTGTGSTVNAGQLVLAREIDQEVVAGATSQATLTIANNGRVNVAPFNNTTATGASGLLILGNANTTSAINVQSGGILNLAGQLQMAQASTGTVLGPSTSLITVDGAGSQFNLVRQFDATNVQQGGANGVAFMSNELNKVATVNISNSGTFRAFTWQHGRTQAGNNQGGTLNVNMTNRGTLNFDSGVFLSLGDGAVATFVSDNSTVNVNTNQAQSGFVDIGSGADSQTTITLKNGTVWSVGAGTAAASGQVVIGNAIGASATLNIESGSTFATQGSMFLSPELGASATVNVSGGSTLTSRLDFTVASDGADATGNTTLTLSGNSTLNTRFLAVSSSGTLTANNSTINAAVVDDVGTAPGLTGDITINGTSQLNMVGSTTSTNTFFGDYSGVISGTGSVTVNGNAFQTLRGLNTYSGVTSVNRGTLFVPVSVPASGNGPLGSATSAVVIGAGPGVTGGFAQLAIAEGATFARPISVSSDNDNLALIRGEGNESEPTTTVSGVTTINGTKVLTAVTFGGTISFTGNIAGSGSLVADGFGSDTLSFTGTTVLAGAKTFSGEIGVATGAKMIVTGVSTSTVSTKLLDVDGIFVGGQSPVAGTNANTGVFAVTPQGTAGSRTVRPNVIVTDALDIAGNTDPLGSRQYFGFVDLGDSDMVIRNVDAAAAATTLAEVRDFVRAWTVDNGGLPGDTGLGSSQSFYTTGGAFTTLAVYSNSGAGGSPVFSTFNGVSVGATDILVKYTYLGDTNLDGVVNATDLARILQGMNGAGTGWNFGDVNYDGLINFTDLGRAQAALRGQGAPLGDEGGLGGGGAAIPEPAGLGLLLAAVPFMSRRRR